jgi:hypothetical protein
MTDSHRAFAWVRGHEMVTHDRVWQSTCTVVFAPPMSPTHLDLSDEDAEVLEHVLHVYLGDLRMEIVGTDNPQVRRELKVEERLLRSIQHRLHPEPAISAQA